MTLRKARRRSRTNQPNRRSVTTRNLAQGIEEKWQKIWDDEGTFWAANVNGDLKDGKGRNAEGRPSYFAMDMFPYPSGKACMWAIRSATSPPMWSAATTA